MADIAGGPSGSRNHGVVPSRTSGVSALGFALLVAAAAIVIVSISDVAPSPERLANGVPRMARLVARMLPPETDP